MSYPLQNWDILVSTTIHPANLERFSYSADSLRAFIVQSEGEKEKLRTRLMQDFYSRAEPQRMEFDVRFNQNILIRLLDRLYAYRKQPAVTKAALDLYDTVSSHISFILDFIQEYFDRYFDHAEKVPASYLDVSRKEICQALEEIRKIFSSRKEIDPKLSSVIVKNFADFCDETITAITYDDLIYQKELIRELLSLKRIPKDTDGNALIKEMLMGKNFNGPDFIQYYVGEITDALAAAKQPDKKLEIILTHQKQLRLLHLQPSRGLYPRFPSTRDTVMMALEKEAEYLGNAALSQLHVPNTVSTEMVTVPFKGRRYTCCTNPSSIPVVHRRRCISHCSKRQHRISRTRHRKALVLKAWSSTATRSIPNQRTMSNAFCRR